MDSQIKDAVLKAMVDRAKRGAKSQLMLALIDLGVSVSLIAEKLGTSKGNVSAFLNGHKPLPEKHIPTLCNMLNEAIECAKMHTTRDLEPGHALHNAFMLSVLSDKNIPEDKKHAEFVTITSNFILAQGNTMREAKRILDMYVSEGFDIEN